MPTTRRAHALAAFVGSAALFLSGCAGAIDGIAAPETQAAPSATTATTSTTSATPTPSTEATVDPIAACRGFFGDGGDNELMWRVPDALTGIGPELSEAGLLELVAINDEIDELIGMASGKVANALRTIQLPFRQAADAVESGGGHVQLESGVVREAVPDLIEACNDIGFDMNG